MGTLLQVRPDPEQVRLGAFSALSVWCILAVLLGSLRLLNWPLGASEMGGVLICVGLCVDYTLHLACGRTVKIAPSAVPLVHSEPLASAQVGVLRLCRARLTALGGAALPGGRGPATGRPTTATAARGSS